MAQPAKLLPKPEPAPPREVLSVQVVTRFTPAGRQRLKQLAEAEGITMQQLGLYAFNLALVAYGQDPLREGA